MIIDVHQHAGPVHARPREWSSGGALRADRDRRLEAMDRLGIEAAILSPINGYLQPEGARDTRDLNRALHEFAAAAPDRFVGVSGCIEPLHGDAALAELHYLREQLGFVAFTLHPRLQGLASDSPLVAACVQEGCRIGLVPLIHTYVESHLESPLLLADLAGSVPDATVVVLDGFGGFHHTRACLDLAARCPNVVFDTSMVYRWLALDEALERLGPERILFGTNLYPGAVASDPFLTPATIAAHRPDEKDTADLLGGNARRLLLGASPRRAGLSPAASAGATPR